MSIAAEADQPQRTADDYGALEPHISGQIMELHHSKHHQTYVTGLNTALEAIGDAEAKSDYSKAATLAPLLNFHGGGHLNHSLFWENLAPANKDGGGEPTGELKVCTISMGSQCAEAMPSNIQASAS